MDLALFVAGSMVIKVFNSLFFFILLVLLSQSI